MSSDTQNLFYSILSDSSISYERKKPFANLLREVYLIIERDISVGIAKLAKHKPFWDHVKECGTLLNATKEAIQGSDKKNLIKTKVKLLLTKFMSIPVSMQH